MFLNEFDLLLVRERYYFVHMLSVRLSGIQLGGTSNDNEMIYDDVPFALPWLLLLLSSTQTLSRSVRNEMLVI